MPMACPPTRLSAAACSAFPVSEYFSHAHRMTISSSDTQPYLAPDFTLLAFITVIVGGLASLPGALLGGLLIGVAEALAATLISPSMKSLFSYGLLILVLLLRPAGLLGRKGAH